MMNISEISTKDSIYQEVLKLRHELFFKEHGLSESILFDDLEESSIHLVMSGESGLIAYGRLSDIGNDEFTISQIVVSQAHQKKGYGSKMLAQIMQIAFSKKAKKLVLAARIPAVPMYEKQGFVKSGSVYKSHSTGVPHIKMVFYADT